MNHFDPKHLVIGVFESEIIESVRDPAMEVELMALNNLKINSLTPRGSYG